MATEIYTPPQELPITTKTYSPPSDTTGSKTYDDPNKPTFLGDIQMVGMEPEAVVA